MTNEIDEQDKFHEANMIISMTLKQLDDALTRGAAPGSLYQLYSSSHIDVSNMNGNDNERRSITPSQRSNIPFMNEKNRYDYNKNGTNEFNGSDHSDDSLPIRQNGYRNDHSNVQTKIPMAWNASVSNWIEQTRKVSSESSGSCTPETSSGESPQSDLLHSSSGNGLDDPGIIQSPPSPIEKLIKAIDEDRLNIPLNSETKMKILRWLNKQSSSQMSPSPSMSTVSCPEYPELQEKLHRLAMARDSLSLQVSVLNEQVGAQKEKIRDLESILAAKRFSYEMVSENSTATQRADLMKEITSLKNKYSALEKDKLNAERRLQMSQNEIERLSQAIHQIMNQHGGDFHHSTIHQPNIPTIPDPNLEMEQLKITVQRLLMDNEQKNIEINNLRNALDEHSRVMENFAMNSARSSIGQVPSPAPPQPFNLNAQLRKLLVDDTKENIAHSNSFPTSLCSGSQQSSSAYESMSARNPVQPSTSYNSNLSMISPQPSWSSGVSAVPRHVHQTNSLIPPSASFGASPPATFRSPSSPAARQLAAELDELRRIGGEMSMQQHVQYSTSSLPRQLQPNLSANLSLPKPKLSSGSGSNANGEYNSIGSWKAPSPAHSSGSLYSRKADGPRESKGSTNAINQWIQNKLLGGDRKKKKRGPPTTASTRPWKLGDVYDDPIHNLSNNSNNKRSTSAPNLGPRGIEKLMKEDYYQSGNISGDLDLESDDEMIRSGQRSTSNSKLKRGRTRSTLRNILGKLTRSTSQEIPAGAFRRGSGVRASASARLATISVPSISGAVSIRPPVQQFVDWNPDQVADWLAEIGFLCYVPEARNYIRSGRHLLNITDSELEKELLMKNPLHKKRLRCILDCIDKNSAGSADRMDVHQVLIWLDLIGLPQFRDVFNENLIDGQMLLCLTAQDLIDMKITSAMNHASLARGIQFLASVDFHVHRIEKSFNPEFLKKCPIPNEVNKWSHGCVSQWLKSIDLAEFTPNLIFSGVHGALMVHEPTFTAESLAEVLQIPAHKTLLRRHLTTQFNNLIGPELISKKRETLVQPFVTFLTPTLKVKLHKRGFSLSRKKSKNEVYVEPTIPVFSPKNLQYFDTSSSLPMNTDI
uniref:SAM domain-containing protein n=1 Tax=Panagrolaimus sp. JU765 TaxID=591449 RepID=A0AC34QKN3_9BILA